MKKKGFTLIELVVYLGVFAVISVFVVNSILVLMKSLGNLSVQRSINSSAIFSMERLVSEIKLADNIDAAQSVFDSSPGQLFLRTIDRNTGGASTVLFSVSGGKLMISEDGGAGQELTVSGSEITNLVFRRIATSTVEAVKIEMTIRGQKGNFEKSENFYDTAVLRRSYNGE